MTPVRTVYQSRMPLFVPEGPWFTRKFVQSGSKKYPSGPRGTPRTTLPSAAPKKMRSRMLDAQKTTSKNPRHTGLSMWARSSTPRGYGQGKCRRAKQDVITITILANRFTPAFQFSPPDFTSAACIFVAPTLLVGLGNDGGHGERS